MTPHQYCSPLISRLSLTVLLLLVLIVLGSTCLPSQQFDDVPAAANMKPGEGISCDVCSAWKQQQVPRGYVVFVHGVFGFGPTEVLNVGYWGLPGIKPKQKVYLNQFCEAGYKVCYASVGPISSSWDRACELFAQIKGTKVDYGARHSKVNNHKRLGKDYTGKGFYPSWDGKHPIHFVAHSLGGNTVRFLEYLIHHGDAMEVSESGPADVSELFKLQKESGSSWIKSITTISTPHDGDPIITVIEPAWIVRGIQGIVAGLVGFLEFYGVGRTLYDFDLDQFGLSVREGEEPIKYFANVSESRLFKDHLRDTVINDVSLQGAAMFNKKTGLAYDDTYYFSVSTHQTKGCLGRFSPQQCPTADMEVSLLALPSLLLARSFYAKNVLTGKRFGREWAEHDGVVPVRSSASPRNGITGYIKPLDWKNCTKYSKARWHNVALKRDHIQIVGWDFFPYIPHGQADAGLFWVILQTIGIIDSTQPAKSDLDEQMHCTKFPLEDMTFLSETVEDMPQDEDDFAFDVDDDIPGKDVLREIQPFGMLV